jgi:hypothetical protein
MDYLGGYFAQAKRAWKEGLRLDKEIKKVKDSGLRPLTVKIRTEEARKRLEAVRNECLDLLNKAIKIDAEETRKFVKELQRLRPEEVDRRREGGDYLRKWARSSFRKRFGSMEEVL